MGKGAARTSEQATAAQMGIAKQQSDLAAGLVKETAPGRTQALNTYMGLAKGNRPGIQQVTAPQINAVDTQFAQAQKAAEQMPPGGMRDQALRDIQLQKASSKSQIFSGGVGEGLARLASMAMGGTQQGIGAFGQAGSEYGSAANTSAQLSAAKGNMAASGAGALGGFAGGLAGK